MDIETQKIVEALYDSAQEYGIIATVYVVFGPKVQMNLPFSVASLNTGLEGMDFSVRASNALKRAGIETIGGIVTAIESGELPRIRNLGVKSYREIQTRLLAFGYDRLSEAGKKRFLAALLADNEE